MRVSDNIVRNIRLVIFLVISLIYFLLFRFLKFTQKNTVPVAEPQNYEILKLVDIQEYIPPKPKAAPVPQKIVETPEQAQNNQLSENIIETEIPEEAEVHDVAPEVPVQQEEVEFGFTGGTGESEIEYFPQHKITDIPVIPTKEVLSKIIYPPMALRQGIEAVVYLELYIDTEGNIRRIEVLKDPGHGFADSAIAALTDIKCIPAKANGISVPVKFRYPVRFKLKQ